ncbi:MAG: hypothetical protein ACP5OU_08115 [Methanothrix sp.]
MKYSNGALILAAVLLALTCSASAQSPGGEMAYMGDLSLVASSFSAEGHAKALAGPAVNANASDNSTQNETSQDNITINATMNNSALASQETQVPVDASETSDKPVLDLSSYASDRSKNNLAGYTNIMYPITGSRGSTTSTSSGSGCNCG